MFTKGRIVCFMRLCALLVLAIDQIRRNSQFRHVILPLHHVLFKPFCNRLIVSGERA